MARCSIIPLLHRATPGNAWWPWSIAATFGRCHLLSFRTSGRISHVESTVLRCGIQIWIMKSHWIRTWMIFVGGYVVFIWDSKYFMITCGGCSSHWRLVSQRCFVAFSPYEMGQSKGSQKVGLLKTISDAGFRNLLCDEEKSGWSLVRCYVLYVILRMIFLYLDETGVQIAWEILSSPPQILLYWFSLRHRQGKTLGTPVSQQLY